MRQLALTLLALIAGFAGGYASQLLHRQTPLSTLQATRFELVNRSGQVIGMWGSDPDDRTVLAFAQRPAQNNVFDQSQQRAAIGLYADGSPFLKLASKEGQSRIRLDLNEFDKPILMMNDSHGVRVALGVEQSDTPSMNDDDWILSFNPNRLRLGMISEPAGPHRYVHGFLKMNKDKVQFPR